MADGPVNPDSHRLARAIRLGLAVGAGTFIVLRWGAKLDLDPSLVVATFFGVAAGILMRQREAGR